MATNPAEIILKGVKKKIGFIIHIEYTGQKSYGQIFRVCIFRHIDIFLLFYFFIHFNIPLFSSYGGHPVSRRGENGRTLRKTTWHTHRQNLACLTKTHMPNACLTKTHMPNAGIEPTPDAAVR